MRKSLLLVVLLIVSYMSTVMAQDGGLFKAPDTVCVRQDIQLESNVPGKQSHYWGFCSGYLFNKATGINMGTGFAAEAPRGIEVVKDDDGNYYGFVASVGSGAGQQSFKRLNFGTSLENTPTVTDFGNMDGIFPEDVNSIYLVRDDANGNWHMFLTGGNIANTSSLSRIDFGKSLANTPNIVNFGNIGNKMVDPTGVFVAKENGNWYGFFVNRIANEIKRFNMGDNISLTPTVTDVSPVPNTILSGPTDIAAILDNGKWYFFITNGSSNNVVRLDMDSLANVTPPGQSISLNLPALNNPSSIMLVRDCGSIHGFITTLGSHDLVRMDMGDVEGPYTGVNFSNVGQILSPTSISRIVRDRDNIYMFITNEADETISRVKFAQCSNANIQYSLTNKPPKYRYDTSGLFNVYYAVNEGLPDMQVQCKQITVLPIPPLIMDDDTIICQGDTATLKIVSINAISFTWTPNYNLSSASKSLIKVWPEVTTKYTVRMPFPIGTCVVDTSITVTVRQLEADAGPNRTIVDGATTILGGPNTSMDRNHLRRWFPDQYLSDQYADFPIARPPHDFTYYLTVTDTGSNPACSVTDTVIVYVDCENVNLPNAFMPESSGPRSQFGLLNRQIVKLDHFNIYDRWGKQVFSTTDPTHQWDGTINGEKAAVGVYVWEVDGFCASGKRIRKAGNVTLIR